MMPYADPAEKRERDRAYGNANRDARARRAKAWRDANPERQAAHMWRHHLKRKFGITPEAYDAMVAAQDGRCAICGTEDTRPFGRLGVDHDHRTGKVRALLCHGCNAGIGRLNDDPDLLRKAADYLERF